MVGLDLNPVANSIPSGREVSISSRQSVASLGACFTATCVELLFLPSATFCHRSVFANVPVDRSGYLSYNLYISLQPHTQPTWERRQDDGTA